MELEKTQKVSVVGQAYFSMLEESGYKVEGYLYDSILFKYDDYIYRLKFDPDLNGFLAIEFSIKVNFKNEDLLKVYEALNAVNASYAVVKVLVADEALDFMCEAWLTDREEVQKFIGKSIRVIQESFEEVYEKVRGIFR